MHGDPGGAVAFHYVSGVAKQIEERRTVRGAESIFVLLLFLPMLTSSVTPWPLLQVLRIEPFDEPVVNFRQRVACYVLFALLPLEAGQAHRRPQL